MSELIQNYLDKRSSMADVGRPVTEKQERTPIVAVLIPDEAYLIREYVNDLQTMEVASDLDFGGQNEGDLFTFVPQLELSERR